MTRENVAGFNVASIVLMKLNAAMSVLVGGDVGVNTCSKVKGRRLPARCVPGIHILSCHQAPHSGDVSMLAALEEIPERISRRERDSFLGSQRPPGGC